jgi:hypothetical protein
VRLDTAPAARRAAGAGGESGGEAGRGRKKPWYNTVWEDLKAGAERMTKSMEAGLISTGDKLTEAGSAVGSTAKAGWDTTATSAAAAAKKVRETSAAAGEKLSESAALITTKEEDSFADAASLERVAQLEAENRLLREKSSPHPTSRT